MTDDSENVENDAIMRTLNALLDDALDIDEKPVVERPAIAVETPSHLRPEILEALLVEGRAYGVGLQIGRLTPRERRSAFACYREDFVGPCPPKWLFTSDCSTYTPETKFLAFSMARKGSTLDEMAKALGVGAKTLFRWCWVAVANRVLDRMPDDGTPLDLDRPMLADTKAMVNRVIEEAAKAEQEKRDEERDRAEEREYFHMIHRSSDTRRFGAAGGFREMRGPEKRVYGVGKKIGDDRKLGIGRHPGSDEWNVDEFIGPTLPAWLYTTRPNSFTPETKLVVVALLRKGDTQKGIAERLDLDSGLICQWDKLAVRHGLLGRRVGTVDGRVVRDDSNLVLEGTPRGTLPQETVPVARTLGGDERVQGILHDIFEGAIEMTSKSDTPRAREDFDRPLFENAEPDPFKADLNPPHSLFPFEDEDVFGRARTMHLTTDDGDTPSMTVTLHNQASKKLLDTLSDLTKEHVSSRGASIVTLSSNDDALVGTTLYLAREVATGDRRLFVNVRTPMVDITYRP